MIEMIEKKEDFELRLVTVSIDKDKTQPRYEGLVYESENNHHIKTKSHVKLQFRQHQIVYHDNVPVQSGWSEWEDVPIVEEQS